MICSAGFTFGFPGWPFCWSLLLAFLLVFLLALRFTFLLAFPFGRPAECIRYSSNGFLGTPRRGHALLDVSGPYPTTCHEEALETYHEMLCCQARKTGTKMWPINGTGMQFPNATLSSLSVKSLSELGGTPHTLHFSLLLRSLPFSP